jgi:hypothetical protein
MTWETRIAHLRGQGYTDDEIVDYFDIEAARAIDRAKAKGGQADTWDWDASGERLDWATLHGRRRIVELVGPTNLEEVPPPSEARRKVGRPRGSGRPDRGQILDSYRDLRLRLGYLPTEREFAQEHGRGERTVRDWLKAEGLPWPPE